jgi:hypothetical protein
MPLGRAPPQHDVRGPSKDGGQVHLSKQEIGMESLKNATSMAYNFETREADVVYPAGQTADAQELQAYFDEATDGRVRQINVTIGGKMSMTLERGDKGWLPA